MVRLICATFSPSKVEGCVSLEHHIFNQAETPRRGSTPLEPNSFLLTHNEIGKLATSLKGQMCEQTSASSEESYVRHMLDRKIRETLMSCPSIKEQRCSIDRLKLFSWVIRILGENESFFSNDVSKQEEFKSVTNNLNKVVCASIQHSLSRKPKPTLQKLPTKREHGRTSLSSSFNINPVRWRDEAASLQSASLSTWEKVEKVNRSVLPTALQCFEDIKRCISEKSSVKAEVAQMAIDNGLQLFSVIQQKHRLVSKLHRKAQNRLAAQRNMAKGELGALARRSFFEKTDAVKKELERQRECGIVLKQLDEKQRDKEGKCNELNASLEDAKKMHDVFVRRRQTANLTKGKAKFLNALTNAKLMNLVQCGINESVAEHDVREKRAADQKRQDQLLGQINELIASIHLNINQSLTSSIVTKLQPQHSSGCQANFDKSENDQFLGVNDDAEKQWTKQNGARSGWVIKEVKREVMMPFMPIEIRKKMTRNFEAYKPSLYSISRLMGDLLTMFDVIADAPSNLTIHQIFLSIFFGRYRLATVAEPRLMDCLFSMFHFQSTQWRVRIFTAYLLSTGVDKQLQKDIFEDFIQVFKGLKKRMPQKELFVDEHGNAYVNLSVALAYLEKYNRALTKESLERIKGSFIINRIPNLPCKNMVKNDAMKNFTEESLLSDMLSFDNAAKIMVDASTNERQNARKRLNTLYDAADSDLDGDMSFKEFKVLLSSIDPSIARHDIGNLYRKCSRTNAAAAESEEQVLREDFSDVLQRQGILSSSHIENLKAVHAGMLVIGSDEIDIGDNEMSTAFQALAEAWQSHHAEVEELLVYLESTSKTPADQWHVMDNKKRLAHFKRSFRNANSGRHEMALAWAIYRLMVYQIRLLKAQRTKLMTSMGPLLTIIRFKRRLLARVSMRQTSSDPKNTVKGLEYRNSRASTAMSTAFSQCRWNKLDDLFETIETGFPIDSVNEVGSTLLHVAAQNGHIDIVSALCDLGAQVDKQNNAKMTPLAYARQYGYVEIVEILEKEGFEDVE